MLNPNLNAGPIGVYDSGVGGLSVLRALKAKLPDESFAYFADSANAPYGERSTQFVEARAAEVASFLIDREARALVIACNTASVVASHTLRAVHALPIVAMEPAIKPATQLTRSKVVLVLATSATIRSDAVARLCRDYGQNTRIILQACPGLADQVERGRFDDEATQLLLQKYMLPALAERADTIVLGCTHYAFLIRQIATIAGPAVAILEPSEAIAQQLSRVLAPLPSPKQTAAPTTTFYTSGSPQAMREFLASIGEPQAQVLALSGARTEVRPGL